MTHEAKSNFELVVEAIAAQLVTHRREMKHDPFDVDHHLFRLSLREHLESPRVHWIPIGGPVNTALAGTFKDANNTVESKPVYRADTQVLCYIFAEEYVHAERLHHDVLAASYKCLGRTANPGTNRWITSESDVAAHMLGDNHLVVQPFTWPMTVLGEAKRLVTLTAEEEVVCFTPAVGFSVNNMVSGGNNMVSGGNNMVTGGGGPP